MGKPPKVNIIYDCRRSEKYEPIIAELKRQKITEYEIWPCLLLPDVIHSINASHKMIVRDAMEKGLPEVCIGEDDLCFPSENGWQWYLKNKPPVYEIYVGGNYNSFARPAKHGAIRVEGLIGFQLYCVHSRYYETFLNTPIDKHIDTAQHGKLMYACYPFPALQREGFSANNKSVVNYNATLFPKDIYQ
jgi:hypothetical protein